MRRAGIRIRLDYDGETIVAGLQHNMVYNFDNRPHDVTVDRKISVHLEPDSWQFLPKSH